MHLLAPFGFYGWGNIGDEATLQGFARLVGLSHPQMRLWVASRNPAHTAHVAPTFRYYRAVGRDLRGWWARRHAAAHVIAGGTPIMDVLGDWPLRELAPLVDAGHRQRKPIAFVGVGTETLARAESRQMIAEVFAPSVQQWSVRSVRDKERLCAYGIPDDRVRVAADMAWLLEAIPVDFGKRYLASLGVNLSGRLVGVNLTNERFALQQQPELFQQVARFLDNLVEKDDVDILFLANDVREEDSFDKVASQRVLAHMTHQRRAVLVPNRYWTPQQMLSMIGCCDLTISMRYHFCLFSALQNVPFIALRRSDKVDDLCWDLHWSYSLALTELSGSVLLDMLSDMEKKRLLLLNHLQREVHFMRERSLVNRLTLDVLVKTVSA